MLRSVWARPLALKSSLKLSYVRSAIVASAVAATVFASSTASAAVVFSDTFGSGSVLNPASYPTPTASSTGYSVAATKGTTTSIASGDLKLSMAATTSGFAQFQARFASTPTALATAGDSIQLTATFVNTSNLLGGNNSSGVYMGLYNSAGANPAAGLQSSGLNTTTGSTFATGNAANWQGYASRVLGSTGSNQVFTRPQQIGAGTTSANQDLLGNAAGGGLYNNPTGTQVGGAATSAVTLVNGSTYTSSLLITLNADGTASITSSLFEGAGLTGATLATQTVTAAAPLLASSFDGFALGYRTAYASGSQQLTQIDYSSITVDANIAPVVPEPASLALLGTAAIVGLRRRKRD